MVKVLTGRALRACISATIVLLSMPPLRKAPSGTSESICASTLAPSCASSASVAAASVAMSGSRRPALTASL